MINIVRSVMKLLAPGIHLLSHLQYGLSSRFVKTSTSISISTLTLSRLSIFVLPTSYTIDWCFDRKSFNPPSITESCTHVKTDPRKEFLLPGLVLVSGFKIGGRGPRPVHINDVSCWENTYVYSTTHLSKVLLQLQCLQLMQKANARYPISITFPL